MLKNNFLKNKRAGSAGNTMSIVVTFVILLLIFIFAFTWTNSIIKTKKINLSILLPFELKEDSVSSSYVIFNKNILSSELEKKINTGVVKHEK